MKQFVQSSKFCNLMPVKPVHYSRRQLLQVAAFFPGFTSSSENENNNYNWYKTQNPWKAGSSLFAKSL